MCGSTFLAWRRDERAVVRPEDPWLYPDVSAVLTFVASDQSRVRCFPAGNNALPLDGGASWHHAAVVDDLLAPGKRQQRDTDIVRSCLKAAVDGPFFPEWEFHTLFGLTRAEVRDVLHAWPAEPAYAAGGYDSPAHFQRVAIDNAMNNLLGYPHGRRGAAFTREVGATRTEIDAVFARRRAARPRATSAEG